MKNKSSKNPITAEDRVKKFCKFLSGMKINQEAKITNISKEIGIHVDSVKNIFDMYETIKDAATIIIVRDKDDKIKRIVRVKEEDSDLVFKKEMRDSIANINNRFDELKKYLKKEQDK